MGHVNDVTRRGYSSREGGADTQGGTVPCSAVRLDWGPGAQATGPAHLPRREHVTRARQCSGPLVRTALVFPKCATGKGLPAVVQSIVRTRSRSSLQKHILFLFFLFVKDKPSGVLLNV